MAKTSRPADPVLSPRAKVLTPLRAQNKSPQKECIPRNVDGPGEEGAPNGGATARQALPRGAIVAYLWEHEKVQGQGLTIAQAFKKRGISHQAKAYGEQVTTGLRGLRSTGPCRLGLVRVLDMFLVDCSFGAAVA